MNLKHVYKCVLTGMRLLLYADLQATDGNEVCFHDPTVRLQDWRVQKFWETILVVYQEHNCDGCIDLGDTTDDRSSIPITTIDNVLTYLDQFPVGWNKKLIGNHEQYTRNTERHVGKLFNRTFEVIPANKVFKQGRDAFVFCSYPADHAKLAEWVEVTTKRLRSEGMKRLALFGHFQVVGAQMNSGLALSGFPKELLKSFDAAFLGHVHKPQAIGLQHYYVGSPFQQNFGEANEKKRVGVFDTDKWEIEWIPMLGFPEYRTVGAREFIELAKEGDEDRYEVVLRSQADTELLFNHPLCTRAETRYEYVEKPSTGSEAKSWTFEDVIRRYVSLNPPENVGIELPLEEVLEIGRDIALEEPAQAN
jgi:hypothetical protein